jgi:predicted aldo/keto reductase-like oxidoreductase
MTSCKSLFPLAYSAQNSVGGTQKGQVVKDLIKSAWENGINFFDNAEIYSNGQSEVRSCRGCFLVAAAAERIVSHNRLKWDKPLRNSDSREKNS